MKLALGLLVTILSTTLCYILDVHGVTTSPLYYIVGYVTAVISLVIAIY